MTKIKNVLNKQSGNKVVWTYNENTFFKYHERINDDLTIIIEGGSDADGHECYHSRISRYRELDTHLENIYTCLDDALSQVEEYLGSIQINWSYELTGE